MLRDTAQETVCWQQIVNQLRQEERSVSPGSEVQLRALGRLGDQLRCVLSFQAESVAILRQAVALAAQLSRPKALAANRIRLGTALQYAGHHHEAITEFQLALAAIDANHIRGLKDFAWQHMGKCLAEMGDYTEARRCFRRALLLRRRRGAESLIASTEHALAVLA